MEYNPLVSVIIPVFNVEPYLSEALDSVIRQTYGNLEIIDKKRACLHFAEFIALNTPDVFTPSQRRKWRQISIQIMILNYINYSGGPGDERENFRTELRELILSSFMQEGVDNLGFRMRVVWYMVRYCPWLLGFAYSVYHPIRMLVLKVTGH